MTLVCPESGKPCERLDWCSHAYCANGAKQTKKTSREQFEAFFATTNVKGRRRLETLFERWEEDDTYVDESTQRHWWTWQNAIRSVSGQGETHEQ